MAGVFSGFFTIWFMIGVGWLLAKLEILDQTAQRVLSTTAFYAGLPFLLFVSLYTADLGRIFSKNVIVSILTIFIAALLYLIPATLIWHRTLGQKVIGTFGSAYVNAGNMGLPIAAYVIGDTSWVAPILLIQVVFLQPLGLAILDVQKAQREGHTSSKLDYLTSPLRNPTTIGVLTGIIVNLVGLQVPDLLLGTAKMLGGLAVPAMLIAFGISLHFGSRPGRDNGPETIWISAIKVVLMPAVAWVLAALFRLDAITTLAVVVMAGLPTAQNVFVFAMRGEESVSTARDVILITSIASVPMVMAYAALVHLVVF